MPGTVPPEIVQLVRTRQPVPENLSSDEKAAFKSQDVFYNQGFGYAEMMNTRPQTRATPLRTRQRAWLVSITKSSPPGGTPTDIPKRRLPRTKSWTPLPCIGSPTQIRRRHVPTGMQPSWVRSVRPENDQKVACRWRHVQPCARRNGHFRPHAENATAANARLSAMHCPWRPGGRPADCAQGRSGWRRRLLLHDPGWRGLTAENTVLPPSFSGAGG